MQRKVLHVVPSGSPEEDPSGNKWKVTIEENEAGPAMNLSVEKTQADAIRFAQEFIASQIIVHGKDGKIKREYTYGLDPKKTKG